MMSLLGAIMAMGAFTGTDDPELIEGAGSADDINGEGGNDTIYAAGGDDRLSGGSDDDLLFGQFGDDFVNGDSGADTLLGGAGSDTLNGGDGPDKLFGGRGVQDELFGGDGNDTLVGGKDENDTLLGEKVLDGGAGDDRIFVPGIGGIAAGGEDNDLLISKAGTEANWLLGEDGDDRIFSNGYQEYADGGEGNDTIIFENNFIYGENTTITTTVDGSTTTEDVGQGAYGDARGGEGNDRIITGDMNYVRGDEGDDTILVRGQILRDVSGGEGDDLIRHTGPDLEENFSRYVGLQGGEGADTITGSKADDVIFGVDSVSASNNADRQGDKLVGNRGNDTIYGSDGDDVLEGRLGRDVLVSNGGADTMSGGYGSDLLLGASGEQHMDGGFGNDTLAIGQGDVASGGAGADLFAMFAEVEPTSAAEITDFDGAEDVLTILLPTNEPTTSTEVVITPASDGSSTTVQVFSEMGFVATVVVNGTDLPAVAEDISIIQADMPTSPILSDPGAVLPLSV
ncbi:MAG: calcium-binding protein [Pseudomonadota bacterium]